MHGGHLQQLGFDGSVNFPNILFHLPRVKHSFNVSCQTTRHAAQTTPSSTIVSTGIVKIKEKQALEARNKGPIPERLDGQ